MGSGLRNALAAHLVVLSSLVCISSAHALTGTISGDGYDSLSTSGCGSDSGYSSFTISLRAGRKWRMVDDAGVVYIGSFTTDSSQRNVALKLDSSSESRLVDALRRWSTFLCGTNVRVKSYSKPVAYLRFNAKFTSVSGRLTISASGKTEFGSGSARYTAQFSGATFRGKR